MLLILLYLAPFVAAALHWRAQRVTAGLEAGTADGGAPGLLDVVRGSLQGRSALARPLAGAAMTAMLVVVAADGFSAAAALGAGIAFALLGLASARVAVRTALTRDETAAGAVWVEAGAVALASASLAAAAIGTLAWFFADPSGVVVMTAFLLGVSSASLLVAMGASSGAPWRGMSAVRALTGPLQMHFAALAAAWLVAATVEPEGILGLGGLMAETETLRSELLLLPVAVTLLSPVVAMLAGPLHASLPIRAGEGEFYDIERLAALGSSTVLLAVVLVGGLSWTVAAAMLAGLAARQFTLLLDESALRARRAGRGVGRGPAAMPAVVAALALAAGGQLAGVYGITLVALGFTSTFACASAAELAHEVFALRRGLPPRPARIELPVADTTAGAAVTMALLVASGPVLVAESVHRGLVVDLVVTAAPALFVGTLVGAAAASAWAARFARLEGEDDVWRMAAWTVGASAAMPALVGSTFGAGAAFGTVLGLAAWAVAAEPAANDEADILPAPVLHAWARTMAMSALVSAPLMNG